MGLESGGEGGGGVGTPGEGVRAPGGRVLGASDVPLHIKQIL